MPRPAGVRAVSISAGFLGEIASALVAAGHRGAVPGVDSALAAAAVPDGMATLTPTQWEVLAGAVARYGLGRRFGYARLMLFDDRED